jgi:GAF domain-containing protein
MLEQMNQRLKACSTFETAIETILRDVVALHGAEFGNIQLLVGDRLLLVAEWGLEAPFLHAFREIAKADCCASGRAWEAGEPVVIEDVEADEIYAPFREVARKAGYQSVQSTPLVTSRGRMLGMASTLFANRHAPTPIEMETVKAYGKHAADYLERLLGDVSLEQKAKDLQQSLYGVPQNTAA